MPRGISEALRNKFGDMFLHEEALQISKTSSALSDPREWGGDLAVPGS